MNKNNDILNELKLKLGEECFADYLEIKDLYKDKKFQVKAWLTEDSVYNGEHENLEIGASFEKALLKSLQSVMNNDYICSEIISEDNKEDDYLFEIVKDKQLSVYRYKFTDIAWER